MKKLTIGQLKMLRNVICALGIGIGFFLWLLLPDTIRNTTFFHIGTGEYASKNAALIFLLIQFFAFIRTDNNLEEIHTDDPEERKQLQEKRDKKILEKQVIQAIALALIIWIVMGLAIFIV